MGGCLAGPACMTRRWLCLTLAAPLMSFGDVVVDHVGPTLTFPGRSMLTGLLANALGTHWDDRAVLQALQDRLTVASAILREGDILTDTQNVKLGRSDKGWTTRGTPEGRDGASYDAPHRRRRDFVADSEVRVVLALSSSDDAPTLEDLRDALLRPARPLFLGRKPCLPSRPLLAKRDEEQFVAASNAHEALRATVDGPGPRAWWPDMEGPQGTRTFDVADLRNWDSGLHGGSRRVHEGRL